jgi:hypothetical protein
MNEYQTGGIYKIEHIKTKKIYVTSCFNNLNNKYKINKIKHHIENKKIKIFNEYFKDYKLEDFKIEIVKTYQVCDQQHLKAYEVLYVNKFKAINKMIQITFMKKLKKKQTKEYLKQYRNKNKEKMIEYRLKNKDKMNEYNKQYRLKNKDYYKDYCKNYRLKVNTATFHKKEQSN